MSIEVRNISKSFGSFRALDNVALEVRPGELLALLGPSGSGKTTLLRIIAGLEFANPGSGTVHFYGEDVTNRHAKERKVGFVFQHYALFRHMTVLENVAFGLEVQTRAVRLPKAQIRQRVTELLRLVQLEDLGARYPGELSGGQRQRVALARALAVEPKVLLLDEPFGALDAKVRKELRRWIRRFHNEVHITSIFVTHDQEEALEVADRVVIMNQGRIEQVGSPEEVYARPANPFVFNFLGKVNTLRGTLRNGRLQVGRTEFLVSEHPGVSNSPATAYVRPQDFKIEGHANGSPSLEAIVRHINSAGSLVQVELTHGDDESSVEVELTQEQHRAADLHPGMRVYLKPTEVRVFLEDV